MNEADIFHLRHMLDSAREALSFAADREREDLGIDRMLMHSLVRLVGIIGEGASKLSPDARKQIPSIQWREMIGMRNRLIHAYYDINLDILWDTVVYNIPKLIQELEKLPDLQ